MYKLIKSPDGYSIKTNVGYNKDFIGNDAQELALKTFISLIEDRNKNSIYVIEYDGSDGMKITFQ